MKTKQILILTLGFVSVFFTGCDKNHEVQHIDNLTARTVDIRLQDLEYDDVTLLFDIEIDNPYSAGLPLVSLDYSFEKENNKFERTTLVNAVTIPPSTKQIVSLTDNINYARLLEELDCTPGSKIQYKAVLGLWVDAPDSGVTELPLETEGFLALPEVPEISREEGVKRTPDVIYVPTPQDVVEKMLELAKVTKDDLVYDLGCGDGRIPITAAKKYGCKAVGYDIDPQRIKESLENVDQNDVGHLVTIEQKDIFTLDLSQADVITLYLLPSLNVKLIPQLEKLKPGSRIVSHDFDMRGVKPDLVVEYSSSDNSGHTIYLWTTPLNKE